MYVCVCYEGISAFYSLGSLHGTFLIYCGRIHICMPTPRNMDTCILYACMQLSVFLMEVN